MPAVKKGTALIVLAGVQGVEVGIADPADDRFAGDGEMGLTSKLSTCRTQSAESGISPRRSAMRETLPMVSSAWRNNLKCSPASLMRSAHPRQAYEPGSAATFCPRSPVRLRGDVEEQCEDCRPSSASAKTHSRRPVASASSSDRRVIMPRRASRTRRRLQFHIMQLGC